MHSTTTDSRIPHSTAVTLRRLRAQGLPIVVFLLAIAGCAWLWGRVGGAVSVIGQVEALRVDVTSPAAAVVLELRNDAGGQWSVYERVNAGDVIAILEDREQDPAKSIEVRAPISGTLVEIYCWPGQSVLPGGPIATIAADYGRHLMGYLPEELPLAKPGTRVTVRPRATPREVFTSEVEFVANQVEVVPRRQWVSATMPQWGVPVKVKMPSSLVLPPGSLVDLRLYPLDDI